MRKRNEIKIGNTIKELRKSKNYTQRELAEKIGVTTRYISDIEQDRSRASYDILIKICNLFEVTPNEIFNEYLQLNQNKQHKKLEYSINGAIEYLRKIKI